MTHRLPKKLKNKNSTQDIPTAVEFDCATKSKFPSTTLLEFTDFDGSTLRTHIPDHVWDFSQYMLVGHCDNEQINAYLDKHPEILDYLEYHPEFSDELYERILKGDQK
jgi:hypothetical protein